MDKKKINTSLRKAWFFRILADIPDCKNVPPFPFRKDGIIIFPSGKFETYVTLAELQACEKKYYTILDSYQFISDNDEYPFKDFIEKLYEKFLDLLS